MKDPPVMPHALNKKLQCYYHYFLVRNKVKINFLLVRDDVSFIWLYLPLSFFFGKR